MVHAHNPCAPRETWQDLISSWEWKIGWGHSSVRRPYFQPPVPGLWWWWTMQKLSLFSPSVTSCCSLGFKCPPKVCLLMAWAPAHDASTFRKRKVSNLGHILEGDIGTPAISYLCFQGHQEVNSFSTLHFRHGETMTQNKQLVYRRYFLTLSELTNTFPWSTKETEAWA